MKNGTIVATGISRTFGVVVEQFPHNGTTLHHVHYLDIDTGKKRKCPDTRCKGEHTCPIHGTNVEEADRVPASDVKALQRFGFLGELIWDQRLQPSGTEIADPENRP